jgi:hypothetical protein
MLEETKETNSQDPKEQLGFWNGGKSEREIIKDAIAKAFKVVGRSDEAEYYSKPGPIDIAEIMNELKIPPSNKPMPVEAVAVIVNEQLNAKKRKCVIQKPEDEGTKKYI